MFANMRRREIESFAIARIADKEYAVFIVFWSHPGSSVERDPST
jgi:hypothetical protein